MTSTPGLSTTLWLDVDDDQTRGQGARRLPSSVYWHGLGACGIRVQPRHPGELPGPGDPTGPGRAGFSGLSE